MATNWFQIIGVEWKVTELLVWLEKKMSSTSGSVHARVNYAWTGYHTGIQLSFIFGGNNQEWVFSHTCSSTVCFPTVVSLGPAELDHHFLQ